MNVRLAGIVNESVSDGPGLRIALFFQGCKHQCPGCHNPQTWPIQAGTEYEVEVLLHRLPDTPLIRGVTLSGGDPFYQPLAAAQIALEFQKRGKDVWAYTGFVWEQLQNMQNDAVHQLLQCCDILIDGPFIQSQRCLNLPFRGSANQRVIDVKESLDTGKVMEWSAPYR